MAEQGTSEITKRTWVVPVDDTPASERALQWTFNNLFRKGDELHLLHVIPEAVPEVMTDFMIYNADPEDHARMVEKAKALLSSRYEPHCREAGGICNMHIVHYHTDTGSIGTAIGKLADNYNATAVIMAKHNKGLVKEALLGSATKATSKHCTKPLVLLHEE
ncbi:hypothetical protein WJX72_009803 [[Myrmecia] bisecta]|uniref:UspA domain-containing protein n=1 Tax=[Myrmecia] bisecta TaxID=41462 RepID=A0AAW1R900_9CHLO